LRPGDTVARIGGDEFTMLLDGITDEEQARLVAERLQVSLSLPFTVAGHELFVSASVGIGMSAEAMSAAELLRDADIAMYEAKRIGRARTAVFDDSMHRRVVDRLARERQLRLAVERALLEIHFQPIVELSTGRISALEALARWPSSWPEVEPREFIPIAEETGLIGELGLHVLRRSLEALGSWRAAGLVEDDVCVSVNVSGRQFDDPRLAANVQEAIASSSVAGGSLRLEITESTLMQDPARIQSIVSEVCAEGVALHLDDFGTGYSSLAALHQFPVDALKVDRTFVAAMTDDDGGNDLIVRSTVALAHGLGLNVIAEGIEEQAQLDRLRELGCEYGQGYLFSKPVGLDETEALLRDWSPDRCVLVGGAA
jgi:predicted signal transduction protein with EAL and GGDEF domain